MVEVSSVVPYLLAASVVVYFVILVRKGSEKGAESAIISQLDKIAQYFSSTGSLEKAIRQLVEEQPSSVSYAKITGKIDQGKDIENALLDSANESKDELFSQICLILVSANRKNDAGLLFGSAQKIKEAFELHSTINSKSEIGAWTMQIVFSVILPFLYFFMIGTLGVTADNYLNGFLIAMVIASAIFQGVAFKQWPEAVVKVPMLFSIFYYLYFILAPKLFSQLVSSIV